MTHQHPVSIDAQINVARTALQTNFNEPVDTGLLKRTQIMSADEANNANGDLSGQAPQGLHEMLQKLPLHQIQLALQNDDQRRLQTELDSERAQYFDFYDLAPVGYITASHKEAVILQANLTTATLLEIPRDSLIGKPLTSFMFPSGAESYQMLCQRIHASGSAQSIEMRMRKLDGSAIWVNMRGVVATGDMGVSIIRITVSDITQRRQLEQAVKQASDDRFHLVADNVLDGIVIFDAQRQIEYVSAAYAEQLGYSDTDESMRSSAILFTHVHPDDHASLFESINRTIQSKESYQTFTYRVKHRLGHYLWRESSAKFQYDSSGQMLRVCIVARDVSKRKIAELRTRIAAVAFESQQPTVISNVRSIIVAVNRAFTEMTGYLAEEVVGQNLSILRSGYHGENFYSKIHEAVRDAGSWQGEVWDRHKDGSVVPKQITVAAVKDTSGAISHYVGFALDLRELKHAESTIAKINQDLAQSRLQLRKLMASNESRLENEKRHIAREVHDELGQVLTALHMDVSLAIIRHADQLPELKAELNCMKRRGIPLAPQLAKLPNGRTRNTSDRWERLPNDLGSIP